MCGCHTPISRPGSPSSLTSAPRLCCGGKYDDAADMLALAIAGFS
jgi:hypothetical protein